MAARKLEREQNHNEAGSGGTREGMLAHKSLNFQKCPLVFTLLSIY